MPDTTLTLIGGPTVLIKLAGFRLLTDPTFDAPGRYDAGGITLEKQRGPALAVDHLGRIDAVLLSHDQLAPFESAILNGANGRKLHVTGTPARHGPVGIEPISGDVAGFLLGVDAPGDTIYVSGDTVWYEGVAETARRFRPRLAILFTGSAKPRGPFHVTMDNNDAIEAAHAFAPAQIIAIHNDGWAHFTESQADLARAFATFGLEDRLCWLEPGKPVQLVL